MHNVRQMKGTSPGLLYTTVNRTGQLSVPARLKEVIFTDFPVHDTRIKKGESVCSLYVLMNIMLVQGRDPLNDKHKGKQFCMKCTLL